MSIDNRYLHFVNMAKLGYRYICIYIVDNYTVIAQLSLTLMVSCVCPVNLHYNVDTYAHI